MNKVNIDQIKEALEKTDGSINKAAKLLNVGYDTIKWYAKKHNIPTKIINKPIKVTKEQLIEAYDRLGTIKLVAKEMGHSERGLLVHFHKFEIPIKHCNSNTVDDNFFSKNTEEAFYWAGFIAADGCVMANGKNKEDISVLSIQLAKKDQEHLETFVKHINFSGKLAYHISKPTKLVKKESEMVYVGITSRQIVNDLKRFGIVPRKSLIYSCPDEILNHKLFNHFLRGYFDGDGTVSLNTSNNNLHFGLLGTSKFIKSCQKVLENNNIISKNLKIEHRGNHFRLNFGGNNVMKKMYDYFYTNSSIYLKRKYEKFKFVENCGSKIKLSDLLYLIEQQKNKQKKKNIYKIMVLLNKNDWEQIYIQTHENINDIYNVDIFALPNDQNISITKNIKVVSNYKRPNSVDIGYVKFIPGRVHAIKILTEEERLSKLIV